MLIALVVAHTELHEGYRRTLDWTLHVIVAANVKKLIF